MGFTMSIMDHAIFFTLVTLSLWSVDSKVIMSTEITEVKEYCNMETFMAECGPDEIVVMDAAWYGRMRLGRCVEEDYGNLGCKVDVMTYADHKCSGRHHCSIKLPDDTLYAMQSCPKSLTSHLEAGYRCMSVTPNIDQRCMTTNLVMGVKLSDPEGVITNTHTSRRCNWNIKLPRGQKINITLIDFGVHSHLQGNNQRPVCQKYAIIRDVSTGKETVVCSGSIRMRNVFLSEGNEVEIQTLGGQTDIDDGPRYALKYSAIGCPDPMAPSGMAVVRENMESAMVFCNVTGEKRYLVCKDEVWTGQMGACPQSVATSGWEGASGTNSKATHHSTDTTTRSAHSKWNLWAILTHEWTTPYGIVVVVGMGIGLGIIIGVILLVAVLVFFKRRDHRRQRVSETDSYDAAPPPTTNGGFNISRRDAPESDKKYATEVRSHPNADTGTYSTHTWASGRYPVIGRHGDAMCTCPTLVRASGRHTCHAQDYDARDQQMTTLGRRPNSDHVYELPQ